MDEQRYPWKRFWYPRGREPSLWADGFLPDPEHDLMQYANPDARALNVLADVRCLILLGEPGIGKSAEIEKEAERLDKELTASPDDVRHFDLKRFTSDLSRELFERREVQAWRQSDYQLHLFLDGYDEYLLVLPNLAYVLADNLRDLTEEERNRLHLRIGCRDTDWPKSLEEKLRDMYLNQDGAGQNPVQIRRLAPLRERDVRLAAEQLGIDADALLDEIRTRDLSAFANRPLTLNFLLDYPRQGEPIPDSREQLFYDGCLRLCEEPSELRRTSGQLHLDPSERLKVAARVAAAMFFSGKTAVWTGRASGDIEPSHLLISDVIDAPESAPLDTRSVTKAHVDETLGTALFSTQAPDRAGWSHQSYGEFLAAWYLKHRGLEAGQVMGLVTHPQDRARRKLVPQLHEVAAWLATMTPDVFDRILDVDPEVLLASDLASSDSDRRRRLATRLLSLIEDGEITDSNWGFAAYRKLAHPDIASQIRPFLVERQDRRIRYTAIWVVVACALTELQDDLLAVAFDPSDDYEIRWRAVWALGHIADASTRLKLRPLASAKPGQYPNDELQAYALEALWPDHMPLQGVLDALEHNAPDRFLYHLARTLPPEDLPVAVSWLEQHERAGTCSAFDRFTDDLLIRGLDYLDSPAVRRSLARIVLRSLRQDHQLFTSGFGPDREKALQSDAGKRRQLLGALLPLLDDPPTDISRLFGGSFQIAALDDVPWLIERFCSTRAPGERNVIATLIDHLVFVYLNPPGFHALLQASDADVDPELEPLFGRRLRAMPLDSPQIRQAQYDEYRRQVRAKRFAAARPPRPEPAQEISRLLAQLEAGELWAYVVLTEVLSRQPNGEPEHSWLPDLTNSPGWSASDPPRRARIIRASSAFAHRFRSPPLEPATTRRFTYGEIAGYKALRLLLADNPQALADLPSEQWDQWTSIILRYPTSGETDEPSAHRLAAMAYARASGMTLAALSCILRAEGHHEHADLMAVERLSECWDEQLTDAALAEAARLDFRAHALQRLLEALLKLRVAQAQTFAESLVPPPQDADDAARARSAAAAAALLNHAERGAWRLLWPAVQEDTDFGRQAIARAVPRMHDEPPPFVRQLPLPHLADLFMWLHQHWPEDRSPFDTIPHAKRSVLQVIMGAGTWDACDQMRRIAARFPDDPWRKWQVQATEENARRSKWEPRPSPAEVLNLTRSKEKRLVQSGRELLDLIVESLERLHQKLQSTGAVERLWSKADGRFTPKDEKTLSLEVRLHLQDDLLPSRGVVVNCEVEVRPGKRTDILVHAFKRHPDGSRFAVEEAIVEVKGNWHQAVYPALERQLVNRYMRQTNCDFGIYLVGCFNCDQWDAGDRRKARAKPRSFDSLRSKLEPEARRLSVDTRDVRAVVLDVGLHS